MDAKELRLGNYVKTIQGVYKVSKIGINELYICPFLTDEEFPIFINTLNPIPLTEEWLLKFGFKKRQNENVFDIKYLSAFLLIDSVCINTYDSYNEVDSSLCLIKYVHQLQNLYFALTGEELTIKQ